MFTAYDRLTALQVDILAVGSTMPLVAITREMGAGGTEIAARTASALNIPLVHHEIADVVAQRWAVRKEMVLDVKSVAPSPIKGIGSSAMRSVAYVTAEILSIAAAKSAVFRGWGAAQLFYKVPHALSVHVGAPLKVRVARMQERIGLDRRRVERIVSDNDAARTRLGRAYYRRDWRDPDGYDLVINTARTSIDDSVEEILTLCRRPTFEETPKAKQILENLRLEALARATLFSNAATRDLRIHVKASAGELAVAGIVDNGNQREEIIRALSNIAPGILLTSRLRAATDYRTRTSSI